MGVGADEIGKSGPLRKITWEHSFKWKPPQYNTVDFLCSVKTDVNKKEEVKSLFQEGLNTHSVNQIDQYKTLILRCGFNQLDHGYINPCQDILDGKIKKYGNDKETHRDSWVLGSPEHN